MSISWLAVLTLSRLLNRSTSWLSTVESGVDLSLFVRLLEKNKVCRNPSLSSHIPVLDSRQMSLTSGSSVSILLSVISSVVSHRKTTSCNFPSSCHFAILLVAPNITSVYQRSIKHKHHTLHCNARLQPQAAPEPPLQ